MIILYLIALLTLSILSYTQVDLNLTLLNWSPYLQIQSQLTQLGYFNRQTNAILFLILFLSLIIGYLTIVHRAHTNKISFSSIKKIILASGIILAIGYPAFTHDLFNYMFDARILTTHGLNPYEHKAQDFPYDDWTRFMQWTHRTYPYGPIWLGITLVPSILGLGKFLITFILFKGLFLASYLAACWYLNKTVTALKKEHAVTATALFALHPLVLIDGVLSPHLDITMIAFALISLYYLVIPQKQNITKAWAWLMVSVGVKFATVTFIPVFLPQVRKKFPLEKWFTLLFVTALATVVLQTASQNHLQPWYLLLPLSIVPFLYNRDNYNKIIVGSLIFALSLWIYLYFLLTGEWINVLWLI